MIRYYLKTSLTKLLFLHKDTFIENWKAYQYLKTNKNLIEESRLQNKQIGSNWL